MNKIFLLGRLTDNPELRYTPSGKIVAQFRLAVSRPFANQNGERETDFLPVILWGKQAESFNKSLKKGQRVLIEGRVQTRSYTAKDNTKRYITEVIGDRFEFIEKRENNDYPYPPSNQNNNYNNQNNHQSKNQAEAFGSFGTSFNSDDEIPF